MKELKREKVSIIGFPMDLGAGRRGVDMGPSALRIAGLQSKLEKLGYEVSDTGDIKIEIMERQRVQNSKLKLNSTLPEAFVVLLPITFSLPGYPVWISLKVTSALGDVT